MRVSAVLETCAIIIKSKIWRATAVADLFLRTATTQDARELLAIYAPYVTDTAVTFEYEVPSEQEFARRIHDTLETYPFLVAQCEGKAIGYAYATAFKNRAAYDWSVQTSIYLSMQERQKGFGRKLYTALEAVLKQQNVQNLYACIACAKAEDARLSNASEAFHTRMGYQKIGHFTSCGYKFGTWYDMIWMEKMLGAHSQTPEVFVPYSMFVR